MGQTVTTLTGILERCPVTFSVDERGADFVTGRIRISPQNAVRGANYDIRIVERHEKVKVSEKVPGTALPQFCPERHINADHTFCIGLDVVENPATSRAIDEWWFLVEKFLRIQLVAERTGRWPRHLMLAHGGAGEWHAKALRIADQLGVSDDYEAHLIESCNWITDLVENLELQRVVFEKKSLPVVHLNHDQLAPAITAVVAAQPRKKLTVRKLNRLLRRLVTYELERVMQEREFWDSYRAKGTTCCGTMTKCPLALGSKHSNQTTD